MSKYLMNKLIHHVNMNPAAEKEYDEWDEEVPAPAPKAAGGTGGPPGGVGGLHGGRTA